MRMCYSDLLVTILAVNMAAQFGDFEEILDGPPLEQIFTEATYDEIIEAVRELNQAEQSGELYKDPHLLLIGQSGVGKSSLAGFLIDGESKGVAGPEAGTTALTTTVVERNGVKYHVHDTVGLGDPSVDIEQLNDDLHKLVSEKECLVLLCVRFDARFVDHASQLAFDVCHSLSPDIWKKVIVAVTHSDILPPEIDVKQSQEKKEAIERLKSDWQRQIKQKLRQLGVREQNIEQVKICFTSHTLRENQIDCTWVNTFTSKLNELVERSDGVFQFLLSNCRNCLNALQQQTERQLTTETASQPNVSTVSQEPEQNVSQAQDNIRQNLSRPRAYTFCAPTSTSPHHSESLSTEIWGYFVEQCEPQQQDTLHIRHYFGSGPDELHRSLPAITSVNQYAGLRNSIAAVDSSLMEEKAKNAIVAKSISNLAKGLAIGSIAGAVIGSLAGGPIGGLAGAAIGGVTGIGIAVYMTFLFWMKRKVKSKQKAM